MKYEGKLYGKVGQRMFDTGKTSADWDRMKSALKAISEMRGDETLPLDMRPFVLIGAMHEAAAAALKVTP